MALLHASNVTGTIQPIDDVGTIARSAGAFFLVDAGAVRPAICRSTSPNSPIDLLACAGHKGLLGPLGTGLLYVRPGIEEHLDSVRQGGTGTNSEDDHQPDQLPTKYEAGNHNVPGLCGLEAGLAWLEEQTVAEVCRHERGSTARLIRTPVG